MLSNKIVLASYRNHPPPSPPSRPPPSFPIATPNRPDFDPHRAKIPSQPPPGTRALVFDDQDRDTKINIERQKSREPGPRPARPFQQKSERPRSLSPPTSARIGERSASSHMRDYKRRMERESSESPQLPPRVVETTASAAAQRPQSYEERREKREQQRRNSTYIGQEIPREYINTRSKEYEDVLRGEYVNSRAPDYVDTKHRESVQGGLGDPQKRIFMEAIRGIETRLQNAYEKGDRATIASLEAQRDLLGSQERARVIRIRDPQARRADAQFERAGPTWETGSADQMQMVNEEAARAWDLVEARLQNAREHGGRGSITSLENERRELFRQEIIRKDERETAERSMLERRGAGVFAGGDLEMLAMMARERLRFNQIMSDLGSEGERLRLEIERENDYLETQRRAAPWARSRPVPARHDYVREGDRREKEENEVYNDIDLHVREGRDRQARLRALKLEREMLEGEMLERRNEFDDSYLGEQEMSRDAETARRQLEELRYLRAQNEEISRRRVPDTRRW